jgi:hypothetical protein
VDPHAYFGALYIADHPTGTISNLANVQGGVFYDQFQVTAALSTVNSLNTTLGAEAGTALVISGGGQIVNASAGTLDGSGNRVFAVASNNFNNNNQGFTINGSATDFVVVNILNGTSNEALGGPITLSGGITAGHVLFNFVGTSGNLGASAGGAAVSGTFLAPQMEINLDNVDITGHLFGGASGTDFQLVSGFNLHAVPEPGSIVLLSIGVVGAACLRRRAKARPAGISG